MYFVRGYQRRPERAAKRERPIAQRINAGFYFSIVSRLLRKNS